jgi:AmmeMemoRadiSam system protein A
MSAPCVSVEDGQRLLTLARDSVAGRLDAGDGPSAEPGPPDLANLVQRSGAFVSIHAADGSLRGCVGYVEPLYPLAEAVSRAAVLAATEDRRFAPVSASELADVLFDVSVLGRPSTLAPEDVEVGRHGLVVEGRGRRGLLLPQVAAEEGWDRETFLEHTCVKAGLPPDAWRAGDVRILGFEARVFREADAPTRASR